jgi:phytoene dehydrogenase-like protein
MQLAGVSPIDRSLGDVAPAQFFGDEPERPHRMLWDKQAYIGRIGGRLPVPEERVPLVVVGGGISGLVTSYLLRDYQPILLEQARRFGGNSQGQSWRGIDYSIGAAYFIEPEAESPLGKLVTDLGVPEIWTVKQGEDPVALSGKIHTKFWDGRTSAEGTAQFETLAKYFSSMNKGEDGLVYPEIPITDPGQTSYIKDLDCVSFREQVAKIAGGPLHPHIETMIEHYCWSSFGATSAEVSAAAGLNFYASEFGNMAVLPGGNAAVAERVLERLMHVVPPTHVRSGSTVFDVRVVSDGVVVAYDDEHHQPRAIHARAVVLCCPKFVVGKILHGIEAERVEAIKRLRYRSYLVANVLLRGGIDHGFYDLYLLGDGKLDAANLQAAAQQQQVIDVVLANYVHPDPAHTVLTLYRGIPSDGSRADLYGADAYARYRMMFEQQIHETILPLLHLRRENIVDLRIARWGHPLPVAATGLIANGTVEVIRTPFCGRVFFVEQDNWALPAFETSVTEALLWAPDIAEVLGPVTVWERQ